MIFMFFHALIMKINPHSSVPRFCSTLWTLGGHPTPRREWSDERKLEAIAEAGFDGVHDALPTDRVELARNLGLTVIGRLDGRFKDSWQAGLRRQIDDGIELFNVHLGRHDTPPKTAAKWAAAMFDYATPRGACVQFETHRDTATETPEKYDELRRHFKALTGERLPTTWDHSHFAVMKHLQPETYASRLLAWPKEIKACRLFHCRPFNGQHTQIPVTDSRDRLTPEFRTYLRFAQELFSLWQTDRSPRPPLWICPEMGPPSDYHLSSHPSPWHDAIRAAKALKSSWRDANKVTFAKMNATKSS